MSLFMKTLLSAGIMFGMVASTAFANPIEVKISSSVADSHSIGRATASMKKYVEEKTKGKYHLTFYGQFKLGSMETCYKGLRMNTLHFLIEGPSNLSNFVPLLAMFDLGYLFPSIDAANKVLSGPLGDKILERVSTKDVKALAFVSYNFRTLFSVKKIEDLRKDLKGSKIRASNSKVQMAMLKAFGMNPTPVPGSETYTALQQGVVASFDSAVTATLKNKWYEPCTTAILTNHTYVPQIMFTSQKWWAGLPEEDRAIFKEGIKILLDEVVQNEQKDSEKAWTEIKKHGIKVITPNAEEMAWLKAQSADIYKAFPAIDPALMNEVKAAAAAAEAELKAGKK